MNRKTWKDLKKGDTIYVIRKDKKSKLYKISKTKVVKVIKNPEYIIGSGYVEVKYATKQYLIAKDNSTSFSKKFIKEFYFTTEEEAIDMLDSVLCDYKCELERKMNKIVDLIVDIDNFRETF